MKNLSTEQQADLQKLITDIGEMFPDTLGPEILAQVNYWAIELKPKRIRKKKVDDHLGCFSYPNCDEGPGGCVVKYGDDAEPYGHRD